MSVRENSKAALFFVVFFVAGVAAVCHQAAAQTITDISAAVTSRRAALQAQLDQLQAAIDAQKKILAEKQGETESLKRDIAILDANIKAATLNIKALNIVIGNLNDSIAEKQAAVTALSGKMDEELQSVAQLLRNTRELDTYSLAEVVLSDKDISTFFQDLDSFQSIKAALASSFKDLQVTKSATEDQENALAQQVADQTNLKNIQVLEQQRIAAEEKQKNDILKVTKGVESAYLTLIKGNEQTAAQIRTELFSLSGSAAIPFEKAYQYAVEASQKTGVRAAVILGIIAEESDLGENIGTGSWQVDMKAPRDTVPFLTICQSLGLDPDKMPVSKKPWYGYGGAMGPAQFIPSTWVLYEDRISAATNHNPPNPWDPEDAFMAAALLMQDNGADKGTASAERLAALRYLAGWNNAKNRAYAFYGDDVMSLAAKYQQQINILNGN